MEVIAVYRESKIKTYGLNRMDGLSLVTLSAPVALLARIEQLFDLRGSELETAPLIAVQVDAGARITFSLCLEARETDELRRRLAQSATDEWNIEVNVIEPVDLLWFHGPHFGDRYGIAEAAYGSLSSGSIPLLLSACSVSSIYLVVPGGSGAKVVELLSERFEVPALAPERDSGKATE